VCRTVKSVRVVFRASKSPFLERGWAAATNQSQNITLLQTQQNYTKNLAIKYMLAIKNLAIKYIKYILSTFFFFWFEVHASETLANYA